MICIDCESAGLRGEIFACAMISQEGKIIFNGFYRHPALNANEWLRERIVPRFNPAIFCRGMVCYLGRRGGRITMGS